MAEALTYEEHAVFVPAPDGHLCGIVTLPSQGGSDLGVVLLSGGNYTRSHRNGMWTRCARVLAQRGFPSIRFDYHGVGDSTGRLDWFDLEAPLYGDARAAIAFLQRAAAVSHILPVATCFGGRTALAAAARDPSAIGAVLFPVAIAATDDGSGRTGLRSRVSGTRWGRAILDRRTVRRLRARRRRRRRARALSSSFREDLLSVIRRGPVWFVYGERTRVLGDLRRFLTELEPTLSPQERRRIDLEVIPRIELAGFRSLEEQEVAIDRAVDRVLRAHRIVSALDRPPLQSAG